MFLRATIMSTIAFLLAHCASTTVIDSKPSGAMLYLDGAYVGNTPYVHEDTKIVGTKTRIEIKKAGYRNLQVKLYRSEQADYGAIAGGIVTLVPFLWTMGYDPKHLYILEPEQNKTMQTNEIN